MLLLLRLHIGRVKLFKLWKLSKKETLFVHCCRTSLVVFLACQNSQSELWSRLKNAYYGALTNTQPQSARLIVAYERRVSPAVINIVRDIYEIYHFFLKRRSKWHVFKGLACFCCYCMFQSIWVIGSIKESKYVVNTTIHFLHAWIVVLESFCLIKVRMASKSPSREGNQPSMMFRWIELSIAIYTP